jgi:cellulose synthase/poly-beta-1,6-N-acetylglucosamine synthase-like glycosyltransferase
MEYYSHKEEKGMGNFIINSLLWTFALYGLFELIKQIIYMCTYTNLKEDGIYVIIAVKNQEEKIEGFLRSIMFKILYGKEEEIKDIIVTDLNSKDKTKEIIEKMAKDYEYLKVSNWKECKDIIDSIDNN